MQPLEAIPNELPEQAQMQKSPRSLCNVRRSSFTFPSLASTCENGHMFGARCFGSSDQTIHAGALRHAGLNYCCPWRSMAARHWLQGDWWNFDRNPYT
eukprot:4012732-Amphidinium_carterae.3